MSHTGAAECLNKSFLNNAVFYVKRQLAGALLRSAPAYAVGVAGDVAYLARLYPLGFLRYRCRTMGNALMHRAHALDFC